MMQPRGRTGARRIPAPRGTRPPMVPGTLAPGKGVLILQSIHGSRRRLRRWQPPAHPGCEKGSGPVPRQHVVPKPLTAESKLRGGRAFRRALPDLGDVCPSPYTSATSSRSDPTCHHTGDGTRITQISA